MAQADDHHSFFLCLRYLPFGPRTPVGQYWPLQPRSSPVLAAKPALLPRVRGGVRGAAGRTWSRWRRRAHLRSGAPIAPQSHLECRPEVAHREASRMERARRLKHGEHLKNQGRAQRKCLAARFQHTTHTRGRASRYWTAKCHIWMSGPAILSCSCMATGRFLTSGEISSRT